MARRNNDLIISQILEICNDGAYKTHIIYKANLNFMKANKYLESMVKQGLLISTDHGSKIFFRTTEKGKEVNDRYKHLQEEISEIRSIIYNES